MPIRHIYLVLALFLLTSQAARAEARVTYTVHLDRAQTQVIDIDMRMTGIESPAISIMLPTWRPGRYSILDFASEVRTLEATGADGCDLPVSKSDKTTWSIETNGNTELTVHYSIYANSLNDRTRHVDATHAFLSGSSVFMLWPEHRQDLARVVFEGVPENWAIATGLDQTADWTVEAPNYDILVDSPIEIGLHDLLEFQVEGTKHQIAIWGQADYDPERLRRDFADIVAEQSAIFGSMPYTRFVFLLHVQPGIRGGTEHYNSTIMQTRPSTFDTPDGYRGLLGLVSHEMFHTWNVKQFRPAGLSPYEYAHENYTPSLWVAEGTTSYYGPLTLARAGLITTDKFLEGLASSISSYRTRPGRAVQTLAESSHDAWIKFNKAGPDRANTTVSFYRKGALASLVIDSTIRSMTNDQKSLDDVMYTLNERFPHGSPGYTPEDIVAIASAVSGGDLNPLFASVIRSTDPLPFEDALAHFGIDMVEETVKTPWETEDERSGKELKPTLGLQLSGTTVRTVLESGPCFKAGINAGDELVAMDDQRVNTSNFAELEKTLTPGRETILTFFRRDRLMTVPVKVGSMSNTKLKLKLTANPTPEQKQAFTAWLDQPWPETESDPDQAADSHQP